MFVGPTRLQSHQRIDITEPQQLSTSGPPCLTHRTKPTVRHLGESIISRSIRRDRQPPLNRTPHGRGIATTNAKPSRQPPDRLGSRQAQPPSQSREPVTWAGIGPCMKTVTAHHRTAGREVRQ
jgi:hypothetical protein